MLRPMLPLRLSTWLHRMAEEGWDIRKYGLPIGVVAGSLVVAIGVLMQLWSWHEDTRDAIRSETAAKVESVLALHVARGVHEGALTTKDMVLMQTKNQEIINRLLAVERQMAELIESTRDLSLAFERYRGQFERLR